MPYDALSALKRLESSLRRKLPRKPGNLRRRLLVLAVALVLPLVAYAAAARWLLSGPRLRALINADPESLLLDYDEATSFWPGRVTIRNLRIRGSDQNVQWIIRLATARVDYSILALAQRTFRVERLRGDGLSSSLRNKLEPAGVQTADASVLPPVPGFADPPLRSDTGPGPRARSESLAHRRPQALHRPLRRHLGRRVPLPRPRPPRGRFPPAPGAARPHRAGARALRERPDERRKRAGGISVSGTVSGAFQPFEPPLVHGSEVGRRFPDEVALDAGFERLAVAPVPGGSGRRRPPGRRPRERNHSGRHRARSRRARSGSASRKARSACAS